MSRIAIPPRIQGAVERVDGVWRLWLHTNDFIHGTFLRLDNDGTCVRVTVRAEEGDEEVLIKPKD